MSTTITDEPDTGQPPPPREEVPAGIARWARLASTGYLFLAAGPLLVLGAALAWGLDVSDSLVFFGVTIGVAAAAAVLVRRRSTALRVLAIVLGTAAALMLFWTAFGLAAPGSFFDFVPGLLVIPGALVGLAAGIGAIRAERRDRRTVGLAGAERSWVAGLVALVTVAAAASAILSLTGRETVDDPSAADAVVDMRDFAFEEATYELAPGSTVLVRNSDPFLHTFTVDALGIDVTLTPGSERLVELPDEPGTYVLYCTPHTGDREDPAEDDMAARLRLG